MHTSINQIIVVLGLVCFTSCKNDVADPIDSCVTSGGTIICDFDFNKHLSGWQPFFAEYRKGEEAFYELTFEQRGLPAPLDQSVKSLLIRGNNHSDDLFSAIVKKVDGLIPNQLYKVIADFRFASNVVIGQGGIGGDPNLAIGVGVLNFAPRLEYTDESEIWRMNFTSRLQSQLSNEFIKVAGNIGVSELIDNQLPPFTLVERNNKDNPVIMNASSSGEIWIMIATDSGFEGITNLYYTNVQLTITRI